MTLTVSIPHDDWAQFPKPSLPILPVIDRFCLKRKYFGSREYASSFLSKNALFPAKGRYALSMALDLMDIHSGNLVLMPSFHCLSMVAPIIRSGADVRFYRLKHDLLIDMDDIKQKITPETKAVVVVHYFGFIQNLEKLQAFCRERNIFLIEDCSHAFFGMNMETSAPVGTSGDIAITSLKKFFPVSDGGILVANSSRLLQNSLKSPPVIEQIKYVKNLFEESLRWKKLSTKWEILTKTNQSPGSKGENRLGNKQAHKLPKDQNRDIDKIMAWFNPKQQSQQISRISKFIFSHVDMRLICKKRIENFLHLLKNLNQLKSAVPLYSNLQDGIVPYMFPLILKDPDTDFKKLKMKKIPIWRWEELCVSDCEISRYYSKHLIQLPCHQSLKKKDLDTIIKAIKEL